MFQFSIHQSNWEKTVDRPRNLKRLDDIDNVNWTVGSWGGPWKLQGDNIHA